MNPDYRNTAMNNERGITIIETTVILSVLFILAGVMSPIVSESITTARAVKAKSDAAMIAMALVNFQKDLGAGALAAAAVARPSTSLPDVLASDGNPPSDEDPRAIESELPQMTLLARPVPGKRGGGGASRAERRKWREAARDGLDDHLMRNRRGYRFRQPGEYVGWNGPYLSADVVGDPWGNQYLVNARWLDGGATAADANGVQRRAVFVVSAGADGVLQTPYEQSITEARGFGDDIVIRIQ